MLRWFLQEAGSRVHEILLNEFLVEFLSVVLFWRRPMRIRSVSNIWIGSVEKLVRALCLHSPSVYHMINPSLIIDYMN